MTTTPLPEVTSPEPKSFVVASALSLLFFLLLSHSTSSIVRVAAVRTISTDREEDTPATISLILLSEKRQNSTDLTPAVVRVLPAAVEIEGGMKCSGITVEVGDIVS